MAKYQPTGRPCGLAALSPEERRRIASMGGKSRKGLKVGFAAMSAEQRAFASRRRKEALQAAAKLRIAARGAKADKPKGPRSFADLTPERRRELAARGGAAAHAAGGAHRFTSAEARAAGKKGGVSLAKDREHMRQIGRKGGLKSAYSATAEELSKRGTKGAAVGAGNRKNRKSGDASASSSTI